MKNTEEIGLPPDQPPATEIKTNRRRNRGEPYTLERFRQRMG
jgi:hypothetical protein